MILCVSATTGIERTWVVPNFVKGGVFRVQAEKVSPSGKGVNAARAVRTLGEPVCTTGFTAGRMGRLFARLAEDEGLNGRWVWVAGETRTAVAIHDPVGETDATLISAPAPAVSREDWVRLHRRVLAEAGKALVVGFAGSLPSGSPLDEFAGLVYELGRRGIPVWVDCDGEALREVLKGRPGGVKINAREAAELTGAAGDSLTSVHQAADTLRQMGARQVIVTMGDRGALYMGEQECWVVQPPGVEEFVSSVGSGDAFLGGLLVGLARGQPVVECLRSAAAAGAANTLTLGGGHFSTADYRKILPEVRITPFEQFNT